MDARAYAAARAHAVARRECLEALEAVRESELAKPLQQIIDEVLGRASVEPVEKPEKPAQVIQAYVRYGPFGIVSFGPAPNSSWGNTLGVPKK
jgi:hypothetical protein